MSSNEMFVAQLVAHDVLLESPSSRRDRPTLTGRRSGDLFTLTGKSTVTNYGGYDWSW